MANPTPDAVARIRAQVATLAGGWTNADAVLLASLNGATIANPSPQGTVKAGYYVTMLTDVLSAASAAKVNACGGLPSLQAAVNAQDDVAVTAWANWLVKAGAITADEQSRILAEVGATQPDPSWPPQLSWAQLNIGRLLDLDDVAEARAAGGN